MAGGMTANEQQRYNDWLAKNPETTNRYNKYLDRVVARPIMNMPHKVNEYAVKPAINYAQRQAVNAGNHIQQRAMQPLHDQVQNSQGYQVPSVGAAYSSLPW
jgi:hypothetical protein